MSAGENPQADAAAEQNVEAAEGSLLDSILDTMPSTVQKPKMQDLVQNFVSEALKGTVKFDKSLSATVQLAIAQLDAKLSKQLAAVMHHPKFQKLEGSWRGMHYLVSNSETCRTLKLKMMSITKKELGNDLESAIEFDQSEAFKKIYTSEFGQAGGEPFGAVIGDFEFENHPADIALLERMGQVGAAGFCPFFSAASPKLFGMDSYTALNDVRDLETCFKGPDYIKWHAFRDHPDSRFVTLTLPRVMSRLPYGMATKAVDSFNYEEFELNENGQHVDEQGNIMEPNHDHFSWMNSSYALGARLTDAFAKTNWCTAIRGYENGGKVEGLPSYVYTTPEGDRQQTCPTEVLIPDRRNAEIGKLGFLPLVNWRDTDFSVFVTGDTAHKPQKWTDADKNANERISARLPYIMAVGRISHYFKVMGRRLLGKFMEREDVETHMRRWIAQYVLDDDKADAEMKAKYPLAEADIQVEEDIENPGAYNITARLRPWLMVEELNASMRLVARIPKGN